MTELERLREAMRKMDAEALPNTSTSPPLVGERAKIDWLKWLLVAAVVGLVIFQFRGCADGIIPDLDPNPTPIVTDGPAVLFAVDGDNMDSVTIDQAQAANSQKVQTWCEDNGIAYRRFDVSDDLSRAEQQWQDMMKAALDGDPPNMVTVDGKNRGRVLDIPQGVAATIAELEKLKQ